MLLQQRAADKYHSGGLWTNTCCSHPLPGEDIPSAAHRRLSEEMGFDCPLDVIFNFTYRAEFENGLTENEFDHVLLGTYNGPVQPDAAEVQAYRFLSLNDIRTDLASHPSHYTHWFHLAFPRIAEFIEARRAG